MRFVARGSVILRAMDAAAFSESLSSVLDGAAITDLHRLSGGARGKHGASSPTGGRRSSSASAQAISATC